MPLMFESITNTDLAILHAIHDTLANPALDAVMAFITTLGDGGLLWFGIAVALLFSKKYRVVGLAVVLAVVLEFAVADLNIKPLVERPRPFITDPSLTTSLIELPRSFSFPSGHTGSAFAAATALVLGFRHKIWMRILPYGVAAVMAFSRLYLCVHYPTDILFGIIVGVTCGFAAYRLACEIVDHRKRHSEETDA